MRALILVDLQNDFMPTGALPVPKGDEVIAVANALLPGFSLVVATQDWHPPTHGSFASNHPGRKPGELIDLNGLTQVLWPNHCVQESAGSEFVKRLNRERITKVFRKGTDAGIDSYSGFFDNGHRKATGLSAYLKEKGVDEVFVLGVATDYCVKFTALDAVREGFKTTLVEDGCRGVNLQANDSIQAVAEMKAAGIQIVQSRSLTR
jgi:nicotinamidase/pyrazinamidase